MLDQNVFFKLFQFFALLVLFFPKLVMAQQCNVNPEAILKLYEPDIGAFAIWDGVHGDESFDERYASGVLLESGHVFATGTRQSPGKPYPELIIAEIDRRGRTVWDVKHQIKGLIKPLSSVRYGENIVISALISEGKDRASFWLGVFDQNGALQTSRIFRRQSGSVVHGSLMPEQSGRGLAMVLSTKDKQSGVSQFSGFFRLNDKLQVLSKREYKPGPDNGIYDIMVLDNGEYLLSGYVDNARGRKSGWLMRLTKDGNIVWQQQYPRGIGGEFLKAAKMPDGSFVAVGTALPAKEDALKAGWVMHVDADNGGIKWQRYFTGDLDYAGKSVLSSKDGLISVMLEARHLKGMKKEEGDKARDYTRLITLNPRGVIVDSLAYFNSESAIANDTIFGPAQERILVGHSRIAYKKENIDMTGQKGEAEQGGVIKRSEAGWIVAAPAMPPYEDPCKPKKPRALDRL